MVYVRKTPVKVRKPVEEMRIGSMLPTEFEDSLHGSLGSSWARAWCKGTGQFNSTLRRYLDGDYPIPQYAAVIVEMLATCRLHDLPVPAAFSLEPGTDAVSPLVETEPAAPEPAPTGVKTNKKRSKPEKLPTISEKTVLKPVKKTGKSLGPRHSRIKSSMGPPAARKTSRVPKPGEK